MRAILWSVLQLSVSNVLYTVGQLSKSALLKDNSTFIQTCHEKRLIRTLLDEYEARGRMGRPIDLENSTLDVYFGLTLIQILDLDERNQVLSTNVWAGYLWKDLYLRWDPELFGNISKVRVPASAVWLPDIKLYNYADVRLEERRDAFVVLQHDGNVQWLPQAIFKSSCSINIQYFPFDRQICKMKFGSWTYDGSKINLELLHDNKEGFDLTEYIESNEWTIVSSAAIRNVIKYLCCPGEPFVDITFQLEIRRQPAFYNYILILPCILLSSLTLVLFWLPPESPAKMQLGMNIFVAFFVLLLLLAESTPPASSSIPLIGAYYCLNMILITLSAFLSVIVVNLYFHGHRSEVPWIVEKIVIDVLARLFCMRSHVRSAKDKHPEDRKYQGLPHETECHLSNNVHNANELNHIHESVLDDERRAFSRLADKCERPAEVRWLDDISRNIHDIKSHSAYMMGKQLKVERQNKITQDWKLVAIVLDRFFFFVYLIILIVSVSTSFDFVLFGKDGNSSSD
ncbi:neuronal acetylcholine receptor subunit beta-3-like isoform X2 [Mya arenaria]|uniref:neuronal acetylcholine receptor subunit beta-3-like isoform X2 n=1 Tax=Mya arenaria TaxID=6604 RepID=UPI0022DEC480|nr:neuronal acetylcholine receptor subunit beta-3-like isoform X2 [Mya arenaria]